MRKHKPSGPDLAPRKDSVTDLELALNFSLEELIVIRNAVKDGRAFMPPQMQRLLERKLSVEIRARLRIVMERSPTSIAIRTG